MEIQQLPQVDIGQYVGIENPEQDLSRYPLPVGSERPSAPKQRGLFEYSDADSLFVVCNIPTDGVGVGVHVDEHFFDTMASTQFEPDTEKRHSRNWQQALGGGFGQ